MTRRVKLPDSANPLSQQQLQRINAWPAADAPVIRERICPAGRLGVGLGRERNDGLLGRGSL